MLKKLHETGEELGRYIFRPIIRLFPIYKKYQEILEEGSVLTIDALIDSEIPLIDKKALNSIKPFFRPSPTIGYTKEGLLEEVNQSAKIKAQVQKHLLKVPQND